MQNVKKYQKIKPPNNVYSDEQNEKFLEHITTLLRICTKPISDLRRKKLQTNCTHVSPQKILEAALKTLIVEHMEIENIVPKSSFAFSLEVHHKLYKRCSQHH